MPGTRQNAAAFCIVLLTAATLLAGCRQPNDREVQALEADVHTLAREDRIYWLQQHTNSANPAFTFLLGKTLLEDYHLADGFKLIEASLAPGFEPGLHYAAKMLATGDGIVPNATRAAAYYDAAAKLGNPVTQYEAAIYRALGPTNINDPAKAIHWFTLAANQGHAESCYQLGRTYHQGRYLPKNEARANYYLKKAAATGHAGAQYELGRVLFLQKPTNNTVAIAWFAKAAANGNPQAKAVLAALARPSATKTPPAGLPATN